MLHVAAVPHILVYEHQPHWSVALRNLPQLAGADVRVVHAAAQMRAAMVLPGVAMTVWEATPSTTTALSGMLCELATMAPAARCMVCSQPELRGIDHVWRHLGALHVAYATRLLPLVAPLLKQCIQTAGVEEPDFRRRVWSTLPWKSFAPEATELNS